VSPYRIYKGPSTIDNGVNFIIGEEVFISAPGIIGYYYISDISGNGLSNIAGNSLLISCYSITPTPTVTRTMATPTPTPTLTKTNTPGATKTLTPTLTKTPTHTATLGATPTGTAITTLTPTLTNTSTQTSTPTLTSTATSTPTIPCGNINVNRTPTLIVENYNYYAILRWTNDWGIRNSCVYLNIDVSTDHKLTWKTIDTLDLSNDQDNYIVNLAPYTEYCFRIVGYNKSNGIQI
jgi:hypothetical protein